MGLTVYFCSNNYVVVTPVVSHLRVFSRLLDDLDDDLTTAQNISSLHRRKLLDCQIARLYHPPRSHTLHLDIRRAHRLSRPGIDHFHLKVPTGDAWIVDAAYNHSLGTQAFTYLQSRCLAQLVGI